MIICGIDPDKSGSIAVFYDSDSFPAFYPMPYMGKGKGATPDHVELYNIMALDWSECHVFIEKAIGMLTSTGTVDRLINYGIIIGVLRANDIRYTEVHPMTWKSALGLTEKRIKTVRIEGETDKDYKKRCGRLNREHKKLIKTKAINLAASLWPNIPMTESQAEAALIAEYGRRTLAGTK